MIKTPLKSCIGTQEIRFGRKTNEIAKFGILHEKTKFTIFDEIWTKNGQPIAETNAIPALSVIKVRRKRRLVPNVTYM